MRHPNILRCTKSGNRYRLVWRLVSTTLVGAILSSSTADIPSSAGAPTVYLPQCANQGPQKLCVSPPSCLSFQNRFKKNSIVSKQYPDNVIGPGSQYDNAYFEFKYVRVYGNGNSTVIGGTSTTTSGGTASTHSSSSSVRNIESLWLVSWMCAVATVMGLILY
jgi:hypothetical protein